MRFLVTGGAGFIGGVVARSLLSDGHEVVVADLNHPGPDSGAKAVVGDLRDPDVADRALSEDIDAVLHLAAATSVLGSQKDPAGVYASNVAMTQYLLERCRVLGGKTFVLASTNAVVGDAMVVDDTHRIDEASPLAPLTPYGATKAAGEMLVSAYRRAYGINAISLRLTNVYGPGVWVKDGLVARLFKAARSGAGITVNGDGWQRRDYVFVEDVAAAFRSAATASTTTTSSGPDDPWPGTVVVGSGTSVSVLELVDLVVHATDVPIPVEHGDQPRGEMRAVVVDRARADGLGLAAPVALPDGLRRTWEAWPDQP